MSESQWPTSLEDPQLVQTLHAVGVWGLGLLGAHHVAEAVELLRVLFLAEPAEHQQRPLSDLHTGVGAAGFRGLALHDEHLPDH